ncbi:MAG: PLP-dependent transferase [Faecalicoccus sp.]|nr:PLP-dependent transferase [Faecalicoccus sp.]
MAIGFQTRCLHLAADENTNEHYGAISYPIYQSATFAHPAVGQSTGYDYSRLQNPTRHQLEKVVADLEYGIDAFALSSGMAAITLMMELFSPGDHIIAEADLYGGSIRLFDHISKKNGLEFTYLSGGTDCIENAIRDNTKAIYIETPTNPMLNVTDIAKMADITKRYDLLLIIDNTFLSPYFQNPLLLGADIVIHSGTKFIGGHNDTLAGFLVTNNQNVQEKLRFLIKTTGAALAPFDCWLILRGIKTLGIRMERAAKNAIKLAEWLRAQPIVKEVLYPGFPDHPGYEIMKRQSRGFGSMITFKLDSEKHALDLLKQVKMIKFAESLGGVETLITYPATQTHADVPVEVRLKNGITPETLRLSTGIEDIEDLIGEFERIFKTFEQENDTYGT